MPHAARTAGRQPIVDTPYTALRAALYVDAACTRRRSAEETLRRVLTAARVVGGPGAAAAAASQAAPPTARVGAIKPVESRSGWRPLIWLRPDQCHFAAYALERRCAVLVEGSAAPDGWEVR